MGKFKHTPGPWAIDEVGEDASAQILGSPNGFCCEVIGRLYMGFRESDANARLITSAPELLEALQLWASRYDGWSDYELARRADPVTIEHLKASRAAIAKATGEA